jgi:hypothetical protein
MIIIQDRVLVSDPVVKQRFICNLKACKGACCVQGDTGAPLEGDEADILADIYKEVSPYLTPEGRAAIAEQGFAVYYDEAEEYGTPLIDGGPCAFITYTSDGIALCGIEQAYYDGKVNFKKPISCHLYPIRVESELTTGFEALNYDEWDICNPACRLGEKEQMPLYQFLKEALIRKYGEEFYEELDSAAKYLAENQNL